MVGETGNQVSSNPKCRKAKLTRKVRKFEALEKKGDINMVKCWGTTSKKIRLKQHNLRSERREGLWNGKKEKGIETVLQHRKLRIKLGWGSTADLDLPGEIGNCDKQRRRGEVITKWTGERTRETK